MQAHAVMQIRASGTEVLASEQERAAIREEFGRNQCIKLGPVFVPELLEEVRAEVDRATFAPRVIPGLKSEVCMEPNTLYGRLILLLNDDTVLRLVEDLTGVPSSYFFGRVYRKVPGQGHRAEWHSDCTYGRELGVTVNLGLPGYEGGELVLRRKGSADLLCSAVPAEPGEALIFRIHPSLQHRVTDVEGTVPRTVLAGWFHAGGSFSSFLEQRSG